MKLCHSTEEMCISILNSQLLGHNKIQSSSCHHTTKMHMNKTYQELNQPSGVSDSNHLFVFFATKMYMYMYILIS